MNTIQNYIEAMFRDFPKTKKTQDLKKQILESMQSKYEDLISQGTPEQDAVASVIATFGSIEELKKEYGIEEDERELLDSGFLHEYLKYRSFFAKALAAAISGIILATIIPILFDRPMMTALYLLIIGIAVFVIIAVTVSGNRYERIRSHQYALASEDQVEIIRNQDHFSRIYPILIAAGVLIIIVGVALHVLVDGRLELLPAATELQKDQPAAMLMVFVAIAVAIFVWASATASTYKQLLLSKAQDAGAWDEHMSEKKYGWLYSVTMPLSVCVFLLFGFLYNAWHIAWIVFPVTAIVTSAIVALLWYSHKSAQP
ncbi:MAG: permease prefix domain 1-containing protein [Erysipelotrichaceae bacterium]|jgi:hypothetical protein|nr:permease prefix domain 1-containing protein [Erysipelotrichaceae bacterium]